VRERAHSEFIFFSELLRHANPALSIVKVWELIICDQIFEVGCIEMLHTECSFAMKYKYKYMFPEN
jgi:hypothetical protein